MPFGHINIKFTFSDPVEQFLISQISNLIYNPVEICKKQAGMGQI